MVYVPLSVGQPDERMICRAADCSSVDNALPRSRARERDTIDDVVARSNAASSRRTSSSRRVASPDPIAPAEPPTIDTILDKISAEGIERLSADERRVLDDHSRRLRDG